MSQTAQQDRLEEEGFLRSNIPDEPEAQLPAVAEGKRERQERASYQHQAGEGSTFFDSGTMEFMLRVATLMAKASLIPESLWSVKVGNERKELPFQTVVANCFLIVNQARMWNVDAFALAQSASVVHGKVVFEGKVIAAVLESTRGIRLRYRWNEAQGDAFGITAYERDQREGEEGRREVSGTVAAWATKGKNGQRTAAWTGPAARQQLAYRAAREWCRLHEPGLILGVLAGDDGEVMADRITEESREVKAPSFATGFGDPAQKAQAVRARQKAPRKPRVPNAANEPQSSQEPPGEAEGQGAPAGRTEAASPAPAQEAKSLEGFELFLESHLPAAASWADIRLALQALMKTQAWSDEWRKLEDRGGPLCRDAKSKAWHRARAIMAANKGVIDCDLRADLFAFRCWLEAQTSAQAVELTWEGVKAEAAFQALPTIQQGRLADSVKARLQEIHFELEE